MNSTRVLLWKRAIADLKKGDRPFFSKKREIALFLQKKGRSPFLKREIALFLAALDVDRVAGDKCQH